MCADLSDLNVGRIGAALFVVDLAWAGIMAVTGQSPGSSPACWLRRWGWW